MLPDKLLTEDISNHCSIIELKHKFIQHLGDGGVGLKPENLRYFSLGKELKDDLHVFSYDMHNDITIQCMLRKS